MNRAELWKNWSEVDYVIALDNFNLEGNPPSDICKRHHHYWFTRCSFYLMGRKSFDEKETIERKFKSKSGCNT